uniref:PWWP domain-containing protein n=1 Tax=Leersia perrieri TaxID=77586 RepID=A0A0D9X3A2_9ORYZ
MSTHFDLNSAADPQALAPPKRGRGRPRKNPPPPPPAPAPDPPSSAAANSTATAAACPFAKGDLVWGQKLAHPAWPGEVVSASPNGGAQLLVSFFGDKALAWCDAAHLRPYEPYFPIGELYDGEADDFDAALDASLHEFSRRIEASLLSSSTARPFVPRDFISMLHDLAADRMGFSNRVHAAVVKAHLRAFDKFRSLPDPPEYNLHLGLPNAAPPVLFNHCNSNSSTPPSRRRGRKRKEEDIVDDSDEDWDPRKKGDGDWDPRKKVATDSDSDVDFHCKRSSYRGGRGGSALRGRPRGRPRKTDSGRTAMQVKDEVIQDTVKYPPAAEMFLQLTSVAADPFNFKGYDSVPVILSFFSKYKDSEVPSAYADKELRDTLGVKKGRKSMAGSLYPATKEEDELEVADGQRGRRKSAGNIYSARKAEDSYWCDIIISDFDDGDTSSDYEGRKMKRLSQDTGANKKMKQEVAPQDEASDDSPAMKQADGPVALILHFSNAEAIPSVDDINSIFRIHGPIMEGATEITKQSKIARVVFSKSADAERAYSSSGKFNAFGPALLRYDLKYLRSAPQVP